MPNTYPLADIDYLSNDELLSGVVENIIYESDILKKLPFKSLTHKQLTYNRELTLPTAL